LKNYTIAIVGLGNPQWPVLRLHVDRVVAAVNAAKPGTYCEVEIPEQGSMVGVAVAVPVMSMNEALG